MTDVVETLRTGLERIDRKGGWCKGELVKGNSSIFSYHAYCALGALLPMVSNNYSHFDEDPVVSDAAHYLALAIAELYPVDPVVTDWTGGWDGEGDVSLIHRFNDSRHDKAQIVRAYRKAIRAAATAAPVAATESELATAGD